MWKRFETEIRKIAECITFVYQYELLFVTQLRCKLGRHFLMCQHRHAKNTYDSSSDNKGVNKVNSCFYLITVFHAIERAFCHNFAYDNAIPFPRILVQLNLIIIITAYHLYTIYFKSKQHCSYNII